MLLTATMLIALGVLSSLLGLKLFKILLPLLGLVSGIMVGFAGVQGVFGSGSSDELHCHVCHKPFWSL